MTMGAERQPGRNSGDAGRTKVVSVITIFLNAERFIAEAVNSVLAQTFPHWELLLVDDGSSDGSSAIARDYATRHPDRIRYLQHPDGGNHGMSATRNLGIREARGEFIALLDADDVWLPHKLERHVPLLESHPEAAMVFGPTLWWHSWTGAPDDASRDFVTAVPFPPGRVHSGAVLLARIVEQRANPIYTCSTLLRRAAMLEVGGFEERFRGLFEDQAFFARFLLRHDAYITGECLDRYRQHPDSACGVIGDQPYVAPAMIEARTGYLQWLAGQLADVEAHARLRTIVAREMRILKYPLLLRARFATRSAVSFLAGNGISAAAAIGRRVLPRRLRARLWRFVAGANSAAGERTR